MWSVYGSWRVTIVGALQDKISNLTRQLAHNSDSRLVPIARLSRQNALFDENWLFTFLIHTTINTLISTKCRELPERILRKKPYKKQDWLIHNLYHLILQIPLLSPSPLTYHWEVHLSNPYLTISISMRRCFSAWEAVQNGPIYLIDAMDLLRDPGS